MYKNAWYITDIALLQNSTKDQDPKRHDEGKKGPTSQPKTIPDPIKALMFAGIIIAGIAFFRHMTT